MARNGEPERTANPLPADHPGAGATIEFPCSRVPDEPARARLIGLYPQRRPGLWMQRLKVIGGVLDARQWRALARAAGHFTPATPLHLTTRQDVELHDLTPDRVPAAQRMLADSGLTGLGACGDTLRNITVCPCSGVLDGTVDLLPAATHVRRLLEAEPGILALPRKFKISFSCGPTCGRPWINDLGFVVRRRGGRTGFRLIGAGSLGASPATGIILADWLAPADVLPTVLAAVRLFAAEGDRQHRSRARLRHVRLRLGDGPFLAALRRAVEAVRAQRDWPDLPLPETQDAFTARRALTFPNGDVPPAAADALADLADRDDVRVRIAPCHQVIAFGRTEPQLRDALAALAPLAEAAKPQPAVVACPATRWCSRALADTNRLADRVRSDLGDRLPGGAVVCISGCPNGCAHSRVADIGVTGALDRSAGTPAEAYDLFVGGGMGRTAELARPAGRKLSAEQVRAEIAALLGPGGPTRA